MVVPDHTRSWRDLFVYLFLATSASLEALTIHYVVTVPRLLIFDCAPGLLGVAVLLAGLAVMARIPKKLTLDSESIEVQYLLGRVRLQWGQLRAPIRSTRGFLEFLANPGTRGVAGPITVTSQQARAILSHPSCPRFNLSPEVVRELDGQN